MMGQLVVMPDVESLAVDALNTGFAAVMPGVSWGTRIPNPRPERFGRVILSGGSQETIISDQARLLIEGWSENEADAQRICALGRAILLAQDSHLFGGTTIATPSNLPDPRTSHTRYTAMIGVRVRATII